METPSGTCCGSASPARSWRGCASARWLDFFFLQIQIVRHGCCSSKVGVWVEATPARDKGTRLRLIRARTWLIAQSAAGRDPLRIKDWHSLSLLLLNNGND